MIPLHSMLIYAGIYAAVIAIPGTNVIAITARARHLLASRTAQRRLNRGAGIAIIGAALSIAVSG